MWISQNLDKKEWKIGVAEIKKNKYTKIQEYSLKNAIRDKIGLVVLV